MIGVPRAEAKMSGEEMQTLSLLVLKDLRPSASSVSKPGTRWVNYRTKTCVELPK